MVEIGEGWKWIAGTIIGLLSALGGILGVAKLLELRTQRRYALEDKNREIHLSNQVKQIEFDQYAFQKFSERLEKVENELSKVKDELSSQMAKNAQLETENKYLKETNERQEKELAELRRRETILNQQVSSLTSLVSKLQTEIDVLKQAKIQGAK